MITRASDWMRKPSISKMRCRLSARTINTFLPTSLYIDETYKDIKNQFMNVICKEFNGVKRFLIDWEFQELRGKAFLGPTKILARSRVFPASFSTKSLRLYRHLLVLIRSYGIIEIPYLGLVSRLCYSFPRLLSSFSVHSQSLSANPSSLQMSATPE